MEGKSIFEQREFFFRGKGEGERYTTPPTPTPIPPEERELWDISPARLTVQRDPPNQKISFPGVNIARSPNESEGQKDPAAIQFLAAIREPN